jgi:hypothetical protein
MLIRETFVATTSSFGSVGSLESKNLENTGFSAIFEGHRIFVRLSISTMETTIVLESLWILQPHVVLPRAFEFEKFP